MKTPSFTYEEYLTPHMVLVEKIDENYSLYKAPSEEVLRSIGGVIMNNCLGRSNPYPFESLTFVIDKHGEWKAVLIQNPGDGQVLDGAGKRNSPVHWHCNEALIKHFSSKDNFIYPTRVKITPRYIIQTEGNQSLRDILFGEWGRIEKETTYLSWLSLILLVPTLLLELDFSYPIINQDWKIPLSLCWLGLVIKLGPVLEERFLLKRVLEGKGKCKMEYDEVIEEDSNKNDS